MPEQFVLLATFSSAAVSKTFEPLPVITFQTLPTRTPEGPTRGKVVLERLEVNRDRIEGRDPLLRNRYNGVHLLDLSLVAEMRPARKTHGCVFSVVRIRVGVVFRFCCCYCRAGGVHPRKGFCVHLYELGDEDAV